MELLIVRHAIAAKRNAWRWPNDRDRPLTADGVRSARRAAAGLARLMPRPGKLLSSPLTRARATADILTQEARWPRATVSALLSPGADPVKLLGFLGGLRIARIAVVGHEPDLGRLIAQCLSGNAAGAAFRLRKMGAARVVFRGRARPHSGELVSLLPPKVLRAARRKKKLNASRARGSVRA
jgi:phosphohistidine phosphatase